MPLTFHAVAINPLIRGLNNLSAILTKGEQHAIANGIDPNEYISAPIVADMDPLPQQIYRCTDTAKFLVSRITSLEPLPLPDVEKTFPELQARIAKVISYLEGIDPKEFEGKEEKEVVIYRAGPPGSDVRYTTTFEAKDYVSYNAHPNFWFHVVTAYALLRMKGVDVGKADYLNGAKLVQVSTVPKE